MDDVRGIFEQLVGTPKWSSEVRSDSIYKTLKDINDIGYLPLSQVVPVTCETIAEYKPEKINGDLSVQKESEQ